MNVKIKRLHADAVIPTYATEGAAAFDLYAAEDVVISPGETEKVPLGISVELPPGYVMIVAMRSGIALKTKLRQPNGIGVIDSDFRGEVAVMFDNTAEPTYVNGEQPLHSLLLDVREQRVWDNVDQYPEGTYIIRKGDRVAQAFIQALPRVEFTVVDTLSATARGSGGFGHSGV